MKKKCRNCGEKRIYMIRSFWDFKMSWKHVRRKWGSYWRNGTVQQKYTRKNVEICRIGLENMNWRFLDCEGR